MSANSPLVSIITVNYNQTGATLELLASLQRVTYSNMEIVVVDNASASDPGDQIKDQFPGTIYIRSEKNLGFAGGNNLGIRAANGDYFMLLNNDTVVEPEFLEPLIKVFQENPDAGMAGSKIKYYHHPEIIQYAGSSPMNAFRISSRYIGFRQKDNGQFNELKRTHYACGAAMMIPRKVIEKVGLMAELYFLYYEEFDWQERIKRAGYDIYYVPDSLVYHKEHLSVGRNSPLQVYWQNRNRILFVRRNYSGKKFVLPLLYLGLVSFPSKVIRYLFTGQKQLLRSYLSGVFWNISHFNINSSDRI